MKKVRFITPVSTASVAMMNDSDCHSPRPFVQRLLDGDTPEFPCDFAKDIVYSPDPVNRFEYGNGSPYPLLNKTDIIKTDSQWSPSNDLELSMLDSTNHQPRKPIHGTPIVNLPLNHVDKMNPDSGLNFISHTPLNVLSPIQNTKFTPPPPNMLSKADNFFLTRGGMKKFQLQGSVQVQMNKMSLNKENEQVELPSKSTACVSSDMVNRSCNCHHCNRLVNPVHFSTSTPGTACVQNTALIESNIQNCVKPPTLQNSCNHCMCPQRPTSMPKHSKTEQNSPKLNAIDKKTWAIEKYEQNINCTDVERPMNVSKEKREPTVADLLKIIKLQNEQLNLLQEKVDKLISTNVCGSKVPIQNFVGERVEFETINRDQHKISIGVMTSLEMVRTSTYINNEQIVKQTYDNAQIQCNRSEISIKEVVKQPVNLNFLDGILPVGKTASLETSVNEANAQQMSHCNDEKTLNEMSLYNVQVDNATTPLMSPEQSLYLDVRDYSGSDSGSDHSNVGWTYYNKVMTHVNGMLQDSDMPSSASALYRTTRQQCLQMQIDKTNISVTKRVTFGDDPPVGTDTSLRMNQLAAKYLKPAPAPVSAPRHGEMSFATRNYMERHKLIQGQNSSRQATPGEMPRFLDITTLKQQPKLL